MQKGIVNMKEKLHFKYQSIGNICKLFVTIQVEKTMDKRTISVFHKRFDNEQDELFEKMLVKLFPNGVTIGEQEINQLTNSVVEFMKNDEITKDLFVKYDKQHCKSYVYDKVNKKLYPANMGEHFMLVERICCDFFKEFEEIDLDYLKKFIKENIEIVSSFTSIETICNDAQTIANEILFDTYTMRHNETY